MYEEKKVKIPFRDIALQILIIVLFVLILLWLFPTKKNMKEYVDDNNTNNTQSTENNNGKNNNNSNTSNNETKNGSKEEKNNGTKDDTKKEEKAKQYEYAKTSEGTYGNYGPWSEWSTNYVAPSNTIEVQTEVRNSVNGSQTYYEQVGTETQNNVVVGTKTNNNVLKGYDVKYIRNDIKSPTQLSNVDNYIYVFTGGEVTYECANGTYTTVYATVPKSTYIGATYDRIINHKNDYSSLVAPSTCQNATVHSAQYNYTLYERIPVYETVTEYVYGSATNPVYQQKTDYTYGSVTYYRYRTRSYQAGTESIKWSNSENDETLIAQGYHFTGNVK